MRACAWIPGVVLWSTASAWASGAPGNTPVDSTAAQVETRALGGGLTFARARIDLPWPPARVFDLMADFDHLGDFVSAIDSSFVVRRDSATTWVRQVGTTRFLIHKTVRMTLRFRARPPTELRFEIAAGDFRVYYGAWKFEPAEAGCRLTYDLTFAAPAELPGPLVRHVAQRDLQRMLGEVAAEIARRKREADPAGR